MLYVERPADKASVTEVWTVLGFEPTILPAFVQADPVWDCSKLIGMEHFQTE